MDYGDFGNRLYCYGAGEGEARVKLSDALGMTEDYVEDLASQALYGIVTRQLVDKSITHPDTLLAWANAKLALLKEPVISYRVGMVDLSEISVDFAFDHLKLGSIVNVIDEELGINVDARVIRIFKSDLYDPAKIEVEIATRTLDITDLIGEVYSVQKLESHIATTIGAGQVIVKGVFTVADWRAGDTTNIAGDHIRTGVLESNNWGALAGSQFDLDDGTFILGGSDDPKLEWDGVTLYVNGYIEVGGAAADVNAGAVTIQKNKLSFSAYDFGTDDLDDIDDGTSYVKLSIGIADGNGYIQIGVGTKDLDLDGWHFGPTEIVGQENGVDQASLSTTGKIVGAGGRITIDGTNMIVQGDAGDATIIQFNNAAGAARGYIYVISAGDQLRIDGAGEPLYLSGGGANGIIEWYQELVPAAVATSYMKIPVGANRFR
jgi:hypothetical protein